MITRPVPHQRVPLRAYHVLFPPGQAASAAVAAVPPLLTTFGAGQGCGRCQRPAKRRTLCPRPVMTARAITVASAWWGLAEHQEQGGLQL